MNHESQNSKTKQQKKMAIVERLPAYMIIYIIDLKNVIRTTLW
jgi:hypothetical protein